jgi:hypothetical protein
MQTAEIISKLDAIQNEFLVFDPSAREIGGFCESSLSPDVRIARAVYWIELLKRRLQAESADTGLAPASAVNDCSG